MKRKRRAFNLKSSIISHLRKIFFWSPLRKEALEKAKVGNLYKCAVSKKKYPINEVSVDHILPVVDPIKGWTTWDDFINRLFCDISNLQVVSKVVHAKKTKEEAKKRKENKK